VRKSPAASRYALPLAGTLLRRLAAEAPLAALDAALDLARESHLQVINSELRTVLRATQEWGQTADPSEVRSAVEKLNRWRRLFPQIEHLGDAIEKLMVRA
jgi:hypothetical protein